MKVRSFCLPLALCCWSFALSAQTVPAADRDYGSLVKKAFTAYRTNYTELREQRVQRAILPGRSVYKLEAKGANIACGHQILTETKWLLSSTADFHRIDRRLDELQNVLDHPNLEDTAAQQDPNDGSWGRCYSE